MCELRRTWKIAVHNKQLVVIRANTLKTKVFYTIYTLYYLQKQKNKQKKAIWLAKSGRQQGYHYEM